jgi:hypothetical protein
MQEKTSEKSTRWRGKDDEAKEFKVDADYFAA